MIAVYGVYLRTRLALQLQYRVAALIWLLSLFVPTMVSLIVWRTVAGTGAVAGYDGAQFVAYFLVAMVVDHCTFSWIMFDFEFQVRQGTLSPQLLKPLHPIHAAIADNAGYKVATLAVVIPGVFLMAAVFHPAWAPTALGVLLFLPALLLAAALRFLVEYALALLGFWTTRVSAFNDLYMALMLFLSGLWVPLAVLPAPVRLAAELLPFRGMIAFPTQLLLGSVSPRDALAGFVLQLVWLLLAYAGFRLMWRAGMRTYSAVGA